jgi:hypothetical protein
MFNVSSFNEGYWTGLSTNLQGTGCALMKNTRNKKMSFRERDNRERDRDRGDRDRDRGHYKERDRSRSRYCLLSLFLFDRLSVYNHFFSIIENEVQAMQGEEEIIAVVGTTEIEEIPETGVVIGEIFVTIIEEVIVEIEMKLPLEKRKQPQQWTLLIVFQ